MKTIAMIATAISVSLVVVLALVDVISICGGSGFGFRQISAVVVGALGILFGRRFPFSGTIRPWETLRL